MIRIKRSDTLVRTIESQYGINLNVRDDALLGNLLEKRGFDSLSQLLEAYRGRLEYHPRRRRVFLSFHAEDRMQVQGFRLMSRNPNIAIEFYDQSVRTSIESEDSRYIKSVIHNKISVSSVVICLIGNGTAWRKWVDWELSVALKLSKGICGVRLPGSRGRTPEILTESGANIAPWNLQKIVAAIETAAARRS